MPLSRIFHVNTPNPHALANAMTHPKTLFGAAALALGLSACSGYDALTTEETDQVLTIRVPEQDYMALRTYSLPKEVVDLCQLDEDGDSSIGIGGMGGGSFELPTHCKKANHKYDEVAIQSIRENMNKLGYREIENPDLSDPAVEDPDVAFLMGWVARDNWYVSSSYPYCSSWDYYYYGCWYGSATYAYNLPTGALLVQMAVVSESAAGEFTSAWTLAFQGLASTSSAISTPRRIERGINQGFAQSSYLADGGDDQ